MEASASLWASLRTRAAQFMDVVNEIGSAIGKGQELTDFTFENSPFDILPLGSVDEYNPLFGYFPPAMVTEYLGLFKTLPKEFRNSFDARNDDGIAARTLYAYESSFAEAASRGYAIPIDHS